MKKIICSFLLASSSVVVLASTAVPTAIFHGFGDECDFPGMSDFTKQISDKTGAYAACIEIGSGSSSSIFENFEKQAESACQSLLADPNFQGEFNVLGLSQGGLIGRYVVERCTTKAPVRNFITLGGPHMGVAASPHCFHGIFCDMINWIVKRMVYFSMIQDYVGPAGYFRDPAHMTEYIQDSVFLPYLNNEKNPSNEITSRFSSLNAAMFVMFSEDGMIYPKETAWFWELQADGSVMPLNQTAFYKNDLIGLRTLDEAGKVQFVTMQGDHLQFTDKDIDNTIVPFLIK